MKMKKPWFRVREANGPLCVTAHFDSSTGKSRVYLEHEAHAYVYDSYEEAFVVANQLEPKLGVELVAERFEMDATGKFKVIS